MCPAPKDSFNPCECCRVLKSYCSPSAPNCLLMPRSGAGQNPHEEELHNVRIEEEELRSLIALGSRVGLHSGAGVVGGLREKHVFE